MTSYEKYVIKNSVLSANRPALINLSLVMVAIALATFEFKVKIEKDDSFPTMTKQRNISVRRLF